jgi:hypothetical protein
MLLDPIAEYNNITHWLGRYIGQTVTPEEFSKQLHKFLNQRHQLKLSIAYTEDALDFDDFTVAAFYDVWNDEEGKKAIILSLIINHPLEEKSWLITSAVADELAMEIIEALVHEYQHVYQYRTRDYMLNAVYRSLEKDLELRAEQEYLGQMDEIDAYAMNIAVRFYITKDNDSSDLEKYRTAFGRDHWVVRRLLKKISKRLAYLESLSNRCTSKET